MRRGNCNELGLRTLNNGHAKYLPESQIHKTRGGALNPQKLKQLLSVRCCDLTAEFDLRAKV